MPAPTALQQPIAAPEAALVPVETGDELLLDMQDSNLAEPSAAAPPVTSEDTEMAVDEEGRPRFAPGKDVVCGYGGRETESIN
jgi:RNA-binding protein PNO1